MKQYKFEKIETKGISGLHQKIGDYHEVILDAAKDGWELVQIFSPPTSLYGGAAFIEIIFSKEVAAN